MCVLSRISGSPGIGLTPSLPQAAASTSFSRVGSIITLTAPASAGEVNRGTGYFGLYHMRLARSQDLFSQLWKEYAHSDSRYMTSDTTVLWIERVTAVSPR